MENWASYDVVLLGCPIWWGILPKITRTFAESYDWSVKTVVALHLRRQCHTATRVAGADGGCGLAGGQAFSGTVSPTTSPAGWASLPRRASQGPASGII